MKIYKGQVHNGTIVLPTACLVDTTGDIVVMSLDDFCELLLETIMGVAWRHDYDPEEIEKDVTEAIERVRSGLTG